MFHGYVPVHIDGNDRLPVMEFSGVVSTVGTGSKPASLPDFEMKMLRNGLNPRVEPHHLSTIGQRVRIRAGTLAGIEGIVVREKGQRCRVVNRLDLLRQSIAIEVDGEDDVEFVDTSVPPTLKKIEVEIEQSAGTPLYQFSCLDSYPRPTQVISQLRSRT